MPDTQQDPGKPRVRIIRATVKSTLSEADATFGLLAAILNDSESLPTYALSPMEEARVRRFMSKLAAAIRDAATHPTDNREGSRG